MLSLSMRAAADFAVIFPLNVGKRIPRCAGRRTRECERALWEIGEHFLHRYGNLNARSGFTARLWTSVRTPAGSPVKPHTTRRSPNASLLQNRREGSRNRLKRAQTIVGVAMLAAFAALFIWARQ